jgi:hypothetical protein
MQIRRAIRTVAMALIGISSMTLPARAQITTGSIAGTVKDAQGSVVPGATVTLVNETQGTRSAPVVTNDVGDFIIPNVAPSTYTVEITMPSFRTLNSVGVTVSAGTRTSLGVLTVEVGGAAETINVTGTAPLIQATTGERSFTIGTEAVQNLPLASRSFLGAALLAAGVSGTVSNPSRAGGGGDTNVMMDGVSVMDTGSNRPLLQMNVESIQEVKVLISNYQAEYGRSSGLQITAITKSGTNQYRGSLYDVERDSDWNANSKTNILNSVRKPVLKERDWGLSIGGPIGKPGGKNRLFFFYAQEFEPRTAGNDVRNFRFPTALERQGDFSQTRDNNGAPYPYIKDPSLAGPCTPTDQSGCFADGGVLGRIPQNRLDPIGRAILNQYPVPNCPAECPTWVANSDYNYQITRPEESVLAYQPALRVDYNATAGLRFGVKYSGWAQRTQTINGTLPGFNDTQMQHPVVSNLVFTGAYALNSTTFLEGTYGRSRNELAGCAVAQSSTGPSFCTAAIPMNANSNRANIGLGSFPLLFPDANKFESGYYVTDAMNAMQPTPPAWVNGSLMLPPTFAWGSRIANPPPNVPFPAYFNINETQDLALSLTKVLGRHTFKTGYYNTYSYKANQAATGTTFSSFGAVSFAQDTVGTNPCDTSFGFSNAAMGCFSSFSQASKYVEANLVYNNREAYVQDNWKMNNRLTLDYGVRFVHQTPQYDRLGQGSNFLPDRWSRAEAPLLYEPACVVAVAAGSACPAASLRAKDPRTGAVLGPGSALAVATLVPGTGNQTNGVFRGGNGIADTTYTFPALGVAPRFGMAYDLSGRQRIVLRGGGGLFFDRPLGQSAVALPGNPPTAESITLRYTALQSLGTDGLRTRGAPALSAIEYDPGLPSSWQWNGGIQMALPWSSAIDFEYVGQHGYQIARTVDLNAVDFGAALLPQNQDPTKGSSTTPGAAAYQTDLLRAYRGYGAISAYMFDGWRTYHSIQLSLTRRFTNGFSFAFHDTIGLVDKQQAPARLQHDANGGLSFRADQAEADALLGDNAPSRHLVRANFVWDMPDLARAGGLSRALGLLANDWQLSGVWSAQTGSAYTVNYTYQSGGGNINLTGSPDYPARIRLMGDAGQGCSSDPYRQFNAAAFAGPLSNSVGLESGTDYLRGCFQSVLDLAIARRIRLGGARNVQLRVDIFNALNEARVTARNTTVSLSSPTDPVNALNLPFDSSGQILPNRVRPNQAGFGAVSGYQAPRSVQLQIRFQF